MNRSAPFSIAFTVATVSACVTPAASATQAAPAAAGCGRISVFDVAPHSRDLYRASLLAIDGQLPGPTGARTFRVAAGRHTLRVVEQIDASRFDGVQLRQRGQGRDLSKTMELDVRPDTTYLLAAQLIEAKRGDVLGRGYWEPVIYQSNAEPCR